LFSYTGAGGFTGGGLKRLKIFLEDGYPASAVYGVKLQGDATFQPDDMTFEDIYIGTVGNSYLYTGFFAWGDARTSPQGIRVLNARNVQIFRCRAYAAYFSNLVQSVIDNFGTYNGLDYGNDAYITGNSTGCDFRRFAVNGDLYVNTCQRIGLTGSAARVLASPSATYVHGYVEAPIVGTFGPNSQVS
jgi:hypothetical protein